MSFIDLPITVDETELEDDAIEYLRAKWPGWEPADGDAAVAQIESNGPMAGNAASVAAQMGKEAFAAYGTKLIGIPYQPGVPASTVITFEVEDDTGWTIGQGAQLAIDNFAFSLENDLTIPPGDATGDGLVIAAEPSSAYNDLAGASVVPISMPAWVTGYTVTAPTSGGQDPQDIDAYVDSLTQELQLTSRAVITLPNYENAATALSGIIRAHADNGDDTRDVEVTLLGSGGVPVSTPLKDVLSAVYASKRLVNVTVSLNDPDFNAIDVAWVALGYQGFDADDLVARGNAALANELSTLGWGNPPEGDPSSTTNQWYNFPTVFAARLAKVIADTQGIYKLNSVAINGGAAWADFLMTGAVPLPTPGTFTGAVVFS